MNRLTVKYIIFVIGIMWLNYPQTADALPVSLFYNATLNIKCNAMKSNEIWKDINGYEGIYQISNLGRVKSLKRKSSSGSNARTVNECILNFKPNTGGYVRVGLAMNGRTESKSIHRLVGVHFISNPKNKRCINHKDGNKLNNNACNLEWCTHSENSKHAFKTGLHKGSSFGVFGKDNPKSKAVIQYDTEGNYIKEYGSALEAMRETGIDNCSLTRVCKNRQKTAGGYIWKHK